MLFRAYLTYNESTPIFLIHWRKLRKLFHWVFGKLNKRKNSSEISWPLVLAPVEIRVNSMPRLICNSLKNLYVSFYFSAF